MVLFYIFIFLLCCTALYFAGNWVVGGLSRVAKFFGWKEFVVAFFVMALAATLPNLFLGIVAIANGVPELSLGDIMGGNVVNMTLAVALSVFFSKNGIDAKGRTVQTSLIFASVAAILPLAMILDGDLSRIDGLLLLSFFGIYVYWLLSKRERFKTIYNKQEMPPIGKQFGAYIGDISKIAAGIIGLIVIAQVIVYSANAFSDYWGISLPLIGILIIGLGNAFPEIYFGIVAAKAGKTKMILGNIMGAVIMSGTMALGFVAVVSPIQIADLSIFAVARYFLFAATVFFFICARTGQKITRKEAVLLLGVYIALLITEIFSK